MSIKEEAKIMSPSSLWFPTLAMASGMLFAAPIWADVIVDGPWVRGTTASQQATGAFMTIISSRDASLVAASSPAAGIVEIHEMRMDGSSMRMRHVDDLALPAGKRVELNPGSYHIMLLDLRQQLRAGTKVPLLLKIRNRDGTLSEVAVTAEVTSVAGRKSTPSNHHHH
jgi:copper(I)-binding protein